MDLRSAPRTLVLALSFGIAAALTTLASPSFAQNKVEAAAKALQRKAMDEDYLTTEFAKAQEKLDKAIAQCGTDKCSPQVRAQLKRDMGVVLIGGQIDPAKGTQAFVDAIKLDPSAQLDPDLKTKELEAAWADAKKKAAAGGGAAAPAGNGGAAAAGGAQPEGDFFHEPWEQQTIRTPVPVYVEYEGEEEVVKVIARYKGFGMTEWKTVELKKMGEKGWGATLPCADMQQGVTQYYVQGFNPANDPVATSGDRNNPFKVKIVREKLEEAPSLPDQPPPTQCAETGDCPPNFPGCKSGGNKKAAGAEVPQGKEEGAFCEEDSECQSAKCNDNKCTAPEGQKKAPKLWVGLFGAFDYAFVPSADKVCSINPPTGPDLLLPVNDKNYYCVASDGTDYPYRPSSTEDANTNPRGQEFSQLQPDRSNTVSGGGAFGNIRIMASLDYAATNNVLVGARLGFVLGTYPAEAAGFDGKSFAPIHVELRGTYVIGDQPLAKKGFAPYVFAGAGVSTFESKVKVSVVENVAGTNKAKQVDAWHLAGPGFVALGGGGRYALSQRAALMGGLRLNVAFGNGTAPSIGPEVGVVFGF